MTPKQLDRRIMRARAALAEWARADTETNRILIDTELGVLESLLAMAPVEKQAKIRALIERYQPKG